MKRSASVMRLIDADGLKEQAMKLDTYALTDFCSMIDTHPALRNDLLRGALCLTF